MLEHAALLARGNASALAAVSLGNELCGFGGIAAHLAPEAVGNDFVRLADEVQRAFGRDSKTTETVRFAREFERPLVVGPDCQLPLDAISGWYARFFKVAAKRLDALTYHLYWLGKALPGSP